MRRQCPPWILLLAAALHATGMARSPLPAQDGLKFLRVAREFQARPFADVVRDADQHPLYPWCVAHLEPAVAAAVGEGPTAWRLAAQLVSVAASLIALLAVYRLTLSLFDRHAAVLAAVLFAILPGTVEVGHETLSDALALSAFLLALSLACECLVRPSIRGAVGFGLAAGLGYWTRPEAAVLPLVLAGVLTLRVAIEHRATVAGVMPRLTSWRPAAGGVVGFLVLVGSYGLLKGELSEKLALRRGAALSSRHDAPRRVAHVLPTGLDDSRWDFSPKEEGDRPATRPGVASALVQIANRWAGSTAWVFTALALYAAWRVPSGPGRWVVAAYAAAFTAVLARHVHTLGYLSDRHVLTLAVAALPWSAAGALDASRRVAARLGWPETLRTRRRTAAVAGLLALGLLFHARPAHASRAGHLAAGRWIAAHATPGDAVLDTRGWAAFVSGCRSYDPWHIRQALTDARLAFVVVGQDELDAGSRRGETLRALVSHAGEPAVTFPGRPDGSGVAVRVFRFEHPASWEDLRP